jgi:uncharacterized protein (TIGR03086 family)
MPGFEAPLPTFLIIGAQKSATRWLRSNIGRHPEVYTAPHEVRFFNSTRFNAQGLEWYRGQFPGWTGEPIIGEATPGYMMWRHRPTMVAKRIKRVVPDAQLIALLRNPVDRAYSAMVHYKKRGNSRHIRRARVRPLQDRSSLLEIVREQPPEHDPLCLVSGGWYAASLKPYQRLFGDQLLVLLHDDLTGNPRRVYEQALLHIGAASDFVPSDLGTVLFSNQMTSAADSDNASNGTPPLSKEERQQLFAYFRDDVRALEKMFDVDLSRWDPGGAHSVDSGIDPWKEPSRPGLRPSHVDLSCYVGTATWVESLVLSVSADQFMLPTPCPEWNVRGLLNRIIWWPYLAKAVLHDAERPEVSARDFVGDNAAAAYRAAADELLTAMSEPGRLEGRVTSPLGEMPASNWAQFVFVNQLTHGWDLATATGQDATIPPSLVEVADRLVRGAFSGIRRMPELFDVEVPVSDTATPTERFVAFLGRDPGMELQPRGD